MKLKKRVKLAIAATEFGCVVYAVRGALDVCRGKKLLNGQGLGIFSVDDIT